MAAIVAASHAADSAADVTANRIASLAAFAAAALGLGYAVSFLVLRSATLAALCLMLGGLATTAVMAALRERLAPAGPVLARWGTMLVVVGALGALVHGGTDLANALHPPAATNADQPSAIDPRGLLTFGASGLGLAGVAVLLGRTRGFPRPLTLVGLLSAALSLALYLGRLIVLDPTSPIVALPAVAEGFVVAPLWYAWLGVALRRGTLHG